MVLEDSLDSSHPMQPSFLTSSLSRSTISVLDLRLSEIDREMVDIYNRQKGDKKME